MACLSSVQATPPVSGASALLVPHFPCSRSGERVPCLPGWSLACSRLRPSCRLSVPRPQPSPNPPQKAPGERGLPEQRQPSLVPSAHRGVCGECQRGPGPAGLCPLAGGSGPGSEGFPEGK